MLHQLRRNRTFDAVQADNLRRIRVMKNLPQEALALDAGIDRSYMIRLKRGLEKPTIGVLERLASALGIKIRELLVEPRAGAVPPKPLPGRRERSDRSIATPVRPTDSRDARLIVGLAKWLSSRVFRRLIDTRPHFSEGFFILKLGWLLAVGRDSSVSEVSGRMRADAPTSFTQASRTDGSDSLVALVRLLARSAARSMLDSPAPSVGSSQLSPDLNNDLHSGADDGL
jgi:transcriptional regulator with XRE-family HTH domain